VRFKFLAITSTIRERRAAAIIIIVSISIRSAIISNFVHATVKNLNGEVGAMRVESKSASAKARANFPASTAARVQPAPAARAIVSGRCPHASAQQTKLNANPLCGGFQRLLGR
jgi:hypothetical protein